MSRYGFFLWIVFLCLAASITLACGAGFNPQREIEYLSVSPTTAEGPEAQFTATGTFTMPPVTVTPLPATWAVVDVTGHQTTDVSISTSGLAQCNSGASGVYTVGAWVVLLVPPKGVCNIVSPFGNPCGDSVLGTAQLTCP
jgi:hypothetical protein